MKIIVGKNPAEEFKVLADDGTDLTDEIEVYELYIRCLPLKPTEARLVIEKVEVVADVMKEHAMIVQREAVPKKEQDSGDGS